MNKIFLLIVLIGLHFKCLSQNFFGIYIIEGHVYKIDTLGHQIEKPKYLFSREKLMVENNSVVWIIKNKQSSVKITKQGAYTFPDISKIKGTENLPSFFSQFLLYSVEEMKKGHHSSHGFELDKIKEIGAVSRGKGVTPIFPINNIEVPNDSIVFCWSLTKNSSYRFQIYADSNLSANPLKEVLTKDTSLTIPIFKDLALNNHQILYWTVKLNNSEQLLFVRRLNLVNYQKYQQEAIRFRESVSKLTELENIYFTSLFLKSQGRYFEAFQLLLNSHSKNPNFEILKDLLISF